MAYVNVNVEVDLSDIDEDELADELSCRGYDVIKNESKLEPRDHGNQVLDLIEEIYQLKRTGRSYDAELNKLIYLTIERIV